MFRWIIIESNQIDQRLSVFLSHTAEELKAEGKQPSQPPRQQLKRVENRTHRDDSRLTMKSQLIAIVAAVLVVGCVPSNPEADRALFLGILNSHPDGRIERVKKALASGANVNARASGAEGGGVHQGSTPLHEAVSMLEVEIVRLLIAKGANVNAINSHGETPLDVSPLYNKHSEIVALLRKHGGKRGKR